MAAGSGVRARDTPPGTAGDILRTRPTLPAAPDATTIPIPTALRSGGAIINFLPIETKAVDYAAYVSDQVKITKYFELLAHRCATTTSAPATIPTRRW